MHDAVTQFLNVDLEVDSASDLRPLVSAFGKKVFVLRCDRYKRTYGARLEVAPATPILTADATIREFCRLIERLPVEARRDWEKAKMRSFSIGIQAGFEPGTLDFPISPDTVRRAAQLNAGIVVTVYAAQKSPRVIQ